MAAVTTAMVKELRERTGAGIKECKDILSQTDGDIAQAIEVLRQKGIQAAEKKQSREARDGRIEVYVHPGSRLVAMVEVNCETDFVARTDGFIALSRDLALHVAATNPGYLDVDEVPPEAIEASGLSAEDFYEQRVLLRQPFVKDGRTIIQDKMKEAIARLGENVVVRRFTRYEVGD
ncbi:MAG: elongation factor Ts [Chloroflexaceae bacterium]|nr:elongation factor Ts [Chloroflexaceae bacterium]